MRAGRAPRLLVPAAVLGAIVGLVPFHLHQPSGTPVPHPPVGAIAVEVLVGMSFVVVGVVASIRRPDSGAGRLMAAVGFAWFLPSALWVAGQLATDPRPVRWVSDRLGWVSHWLGGGRLGEERGAGIAQAAAAFSRSVSQFFEFFYAVVLAHLFAAFPEGKLSGRAVRALVGGLYVWWLGTAAGRVFLGVPRAACAGCPLNVIPVQRLDDFWFATIGPHIVHSPQPVEVVGTTALFLGVVAVVVGKWRRASPRRRRALSPVFWASVPALTLVTVLEVGGNMAVRLPYPMGPLLWWAGPLVLVALPALFLVGLLRARLAQSAVSELMVKLGGYPVRLQLALAEALKDPSLEVAYWLTDKGMFVDGNGIPVQLEPPQPGRTVHMLERDGERIAALVLDASLQEEPGLVQSVGAAALLALENERLHAQVLAQLEEVRAQRVRLLDIGYEARRRIERDLHDGAQQRFLAVLMGLRAAQMRESAPQLQAELQHVADDLKGAIDELRDLVHGIYPPVLAAEGLRAALLTLAERTPLPLALTLPEGRYPERVESTAYFVVSEALTNVVKYAEATRADVVVRHGPDRLVVEISDDGRGGADPSRGSGLHGLIERVGALEGRVRIDSPVGRGTRIVAEIPYSSPHESRTHEATTLAPLGA